KSEPQTKPKALNFALCFARGSYVTIFDAEDIPAPGQLRAALEVFRDGPDNLACVQAHLGFYNGRQNWLTRQFTLEYAGLFHVQLPILSRLGLPIMLGGTSNHFRADILRKIGGWDPYNVTEDADLGIRLERLGYQCAIVDSCTGEEANSRLGNWIRQRSRWLKGWMQTYAVHMRHPAALFRDMGLRKFIAFQAMTAGMIISALTHPFFLAYLLHGLWSGQVLDVIDYTGGSTILTLAGFNLVMGYVSAGLLAARGSRRSKTEYLMADVLFIPVYWLLISLASYKALWQFFSRRFYWEKTEHGLGG
ncbi:MAG TPA: glycosyltransferase, partial [Rhodobacteraceae bacterium]|nr:glycosyltransferase [Paracoccaceae bacterium]